MENILGYEKSKVSKFNYKPPFLFAIPLDVYSDEIEKERDKESFLKIQRLEKKCEQLRQKLHVYIQAYSQRLEATKYLVSRTLAFKKNMQGRKAENSLKLYKEL
ncbi:MAG: hypothetical protein JWQ09_4772 [Segetibacter sp.]|nr:hypothetical protein [Segetibacter sp.]